ncbi:MAG: CoA transferase [Dehalococcoidia bacterium]|nr:CoA transferase [Dehalococcoidia bacterium]
MPGALDGMKILDMTQYEAGTSCTQYLSWLGAEVIKIESPFGDPGRSVQNHKQTTPGDSQYFMNYNSGKKSVVLNLKTEQGRQLFLDLVPMFDAFVENYGPDVLESFGIDTKQMQSINPKLIIARIKGFGLSGPNAGFNVFDPVAQAAGGALSITGEPDGPPMPIGPTYADTGTGVQVALGIVSAYVSALKTGVGQVIDASMQECVTMFMRTADMPAWGTRPAQRRGTARGDIGGGMYRCKGGGTNDWLMLFPGTDSMLDSLYTAIGRPELATDDKFATSVGLREHKEEFREVIESWTLQHDKKEAMAILCEAGVPASYVYTTLDLFEDDHLAQRDFIHEVQHPINGTVKLMRAPLVMAGIAAPTRSPLLGEHSEEVLSQLLNLSADDFSTLSEEGITGPK